MTSKQGAIPARFRKRGKSERSDFPSFFKTVDMPSTCALSSSNEPDNGLKTPSKTPFPVQRRKRTKSLFQLPNSDRRSRLGNPVRTRQSTASNNRRLSAAVLPGEPCLPGGMSLIPSRIRPAGANLLDFANMPQFSCLDSCLFGYCR